MLIGKSAACSRLGEVGMADVVRLGAAPSATAASEHTSASPTKSKAEKEII
jgi:hypothetical protein